MLCKRIIPCLDVQDGRVVKGVEFRNHEVQGQILEMACTLGTQSVVIGKENTDGISSLT